jgi:hypothetical protein
LKPFLKLTRKEKRKFNQKQLWKKNQLARWNSF